MPYPWYTDSEIDDLCAGLINSASKIRYLRALGLHVERKPNGRPLVMREHAESVLSRSVDSSAANKPDTEPATPPTNREALIQLFRSRRECRQGKTSA